VSPYPNPFNAQVRIPYVLDEAASVEVTVHALNGQRVRGLVEADRHPGRHEALWDGRDDDGAAVASGAYLVRLRAASSVDLTRVALVR
jgi:flagellar hook assembly protein FlgD